MRLLILAILLLLPLNGGVEIKNAWVRVGAKGLNTAVYFDIVNNSSAADTLIRAESKDAQKVELHETYIQGNEMGMRQSKMIIVNGNSAFSFKPRGHHIMLIGLKDNYKAGEAKELTLHFRKAGKIKVKAAVKK